MDLAVSGRHHFSSGEAHKALGVSRAAARQALHRLSRKGLIAQPARGFHVVVPPEHRWHECLPADQFIPELMERRGRPYYASLLSAAEYHGAAHQRPQVFQVMTGRAHRPIRCGRVRVDFAVRSRIREVPVQSIRTPRGTVLVSTPEATAIDLVGYRRRAGGLDNVATVLVELAEAIEPDRLAGAARAGPVAWAQRLGFLLESVGAGDRAVHLHAYVDGAARQTVPLLPGASRDGARRDRRWRLLVNAEVEPDL